MIVRVHYHDLTYKKIVQQIDMPETATVQDLLDHLEVPLQKAVVINGRVVRLETPLKENAEVFLFSQTSGG